ncbi:hypothetical protein Agsp01_08330 [Agromyces sp. NBRC 114283]|nr:hypothetical protein Agsp01_08330 [Agromyces sp. NBRC 114283]
MEESAATEYVVSAVREELRDDYVEFWLLLRIIRRSFPEADEARIRELTEVILEELLEGAVMGDLDGDTGRFNPWPGNDQLKTVMSAWRSLGREPNMGDIGWLAALPLDA